MFFYAYLASFEQVWQGLGSSRPDSLKWAESQLWGLLWDYTLEKIDLMPNLHTTLKRIVARVSDSIPISELTWFTPCKSFLHSETHVNN